MPTLIQNHKKKEVVTKLQKVYSVMNQAIDLSKVEYGDLSEWEYPTRYDTLTVDEAVEVFQKYIGKNLKYSKIEKGVTGFSVYLDDGGIISSNTLLRDMVYYTNYKALQKPKGGVNQFWFRFSPNSKSESPYNQGWDKYNAGKGFEPYAWHWDGTKAGLITNTADPTYGCNESATSYCAKLIQFEGWEIPKDYPFKF